MCEELGLSAMTSNSNTELACNRSNTPLKWMVAGQFKALFGGYVVIKLIILTFPSLQVVNSETHIKTECFQTVTHYYDNPELTGKSFLTYVYKNDHFHAVSIYLRCDTYSIITIEAIELSLPADESEYCLDSRHTDYRECSSDSQCDCCEFPKKRCSSPLDDIQDSQEECNGRRNCTINVESQFLVTCDGRQYDCETRKCHSRWAKVLYNCTPGEFMTTNDVIADSEVTSQGNPEEGFNFSWWHILFILICINITVINFYMLWRLVKRKCYPCVKNHHAGNTNADLPMKAVKTEEQDVTKTDEECKEMLSEDSSSEDSGLDVNSASAQPSSMDI